MLFFAEFTSDCATTFKTTKTEFEEITTVNIKELKDLLAEIEANDCFIHPSKMKTFHSRISQLESSIKVWVDDITFRLKGLVETQIEILDDRFQKICEDLNDQKIAAKGKCSNIFLAILLVAYPVQHTKVIDKQEGAETTNFTTGDKEFSCFHNSRVVFEAITFNFLFRSSSLLTSRHCS